MNSYSKRHDFLTSLILIQIDNARSNYAVAASITELLKDLPDSLTQGSDKKGDSNRSSFCEDTPQQVTNTRTNYLNCELKILLQ